MPVPFPLNTIHFDAASGELSGGPVDEGRRTIGGLAGLFEDEAARAAMPQELAVYRTQSFRPVPDGTAGGLCWGTTFLNPGLVGDEYFMTAGHYHARDDAPEFYWCLHGSGLLLLMGHDGGFRTQEMGPGVLFYIPGSTAHRMVNTGAETLIFAACWPSDSGHDYAAAKAQGFCRVKCRNGRPAVG